MIETKEEYLALSENARDTIETLLRHAAQLRVLAAVMTAGFFGMTIIALVALGHVK